MSDPSANQPPGHTDHPSRHSDFGAAGAEERVGKLVAEIGVVIRSADPDRREELKELTENGFNPLPLQLPRAEQTKPRQIPVQVEKAAA